MNEEFIYQIPDILTRLSMIEEEHRKEQYVQRINDVFVMVLDLSKRIGLLKKSIKNICGVQDISDLI